MIVGVSSPRATPPPTPITLSKVLIVEGRDDSEFCEALLKQLGLAEEIEIRDTQGVDNLYDYLEPLVIASGFRASVVSLGIVRDADNDVGSAFQSACGVLRKLKLSVPKQPAGRSRGKPRTSVFIFPNCKDSGTLESLCLATVGAEPAMPCVQQYFDCLSSAGVDLTGNLLKAKVRAFIASKPKPTLPLGTAAHAAYWNWNSVALEPLKKFLRAL